MNRRRVALFQAANFLGSTANSMAFVAIPWLILELTDSATSTGLIVGLSFLPVILMAPLAGVVIDWWGARPVSVVSDVLSATSVALIPLAALTIGLTPGVILAAAVLGAFFDPAGYTARKTMISPVARNTGIRLEKLNSIHEALFGLGFAVGPALAATSIGVVGTTATFWVVGALSLLAAVAVVALGAIRAENGEELGDEETRGWATAMHGFTSLGRDRALFILTGFMVIVDLVYMPSEVVILPTYFQQTNSPLGLGLVVSAMAAGGIVGSYLFDWLSQRMSISRILRLCVLSAASALFGLAFFPPLPLMVIAGVVVGLTWGPMGPLLNTLVHTRFSERVQGRVFGAQMALFSAGPPIGMMLAGPLVDFFGVVVVFPILIALVWVLGIFLASLPLLSRFNETPQD